MGLVPLAFETVIIVNCLFTLLILTTIILQSKHTLNASEYDLIGKLRLPQKYDATREVRTADGARCDLLSPLYAIEVDYPKKWAEAIGQSLYYGQQFRRTPAIILLTRSRSSDQHLVDRCQSVCEAYGILLFVEDI